MLTKFGETYKYYLVRNKRTGYDLKKLYDFAGGSGGYAPAKLMKFFGGTLFYVVKVWLTSQF